MSQKGNKPIYDLEERTFQFAKAVREYVKTLPVNDYIAVDAVQLIKASGSVGANYIEANEPISKKDFIYRIKVCRKEAKESAFFLRLLYETNNKEKETGSKLRDEAIQLKKIFSSIIDKTQ
ncbi:MAG: four helix bundle protein [Bacteroidota bacterium]